MSIKGPFPKPLVAGWLGLLAGFQVCVGTEVDFDATAFDSKVKPFLEEYCVSCHNWEKQKGERHFDERLCLLFRSRLLIKTFNHRHRCTHILRNEVDADFL